MITAASFDDKAPALETNRAGLAEKCTECGACVRECAFLQKYGTPKAMAAQYTEDGPGCREQAFECSLCGLCGAVCPEDLVPGEFFYLLRCKAVDLGEATFSKHKKLVKYEQRGTSPLFSHAALPEGCDTVFFPGCALAGTRSETTWKLFEHMRASIPNLGMVLDCCSKPSHDLGRQAEVEDTFGQLNRFLTDKGIRKVLAACPNCVRTFEHYGRDLAVETVYQHLDRVSLPDTGEVRGMITIHDPCALRDSTEAHSAVRSLAAKKGLDVAEMKHSGAQALCCGEGGGVPCVAPDLARAWTDLRAREAGKRTVITYCAGCTHLLGKQTTISHVLDLLFEPVKALQGKVKAAKAPFTYLHRLKLKHRLKRKVKGQPTEPYRGRRGRESEGEFDKITRSTGLAGGEESGEPEFLTGLTGSTGETGKLCLESKLLCSRPGGTPEVSEGVQTKRDSGRRSFRRGRRIGILAMLAATIILIRYSGLAEQLNAKDLGGRVAAMGIYAPLAYMALYAIAPVLLLPGLPISVAGAIIFGPFWGVVYTIVGSTIGACNAFLISRFLARSWVADKLRGTRWQKLEHDVKVHGWKVVAGARLIPLLPFNLLNYAFGLTGIRFSHYALATFFGMLPATIGFIVFSSSLPDLLQGRLSWPFIAGAALIIFVSLLPVIYGKNRKKADGSCNHG